MSSKTVVTVLLVSLAAAAVLGQPYGDNVGDVTDNLITDNVPPIFIYPPRPGLFERAPPQPSEVLARIAGTEAESPVTTTARDFTVNPWTLNRNYEGQWNTTVGASVTFIWPEGLHSVYKLNSGDCPSSFNNQEQIAAPTEASQVTYTFKNAGTYWFACAVDDHCKQGMKIKFTVT